MAQVPGSLCVGAATPDGQVAPHNLDAQGNLKVNVAAGGAAGGTSSNFGAAMPGTGTAAGASDGVNMQPLQVDGSGNLKVAAAVTVTPVVSTTASAPAQTVVGTTAAQVLAANNARKRVMLQNAGTTVIKIVFGAATPTQAAYHFALAPGGTANDGSSPAWRDEMWQGAVQAISSAAGGLLLVTELT